MPIACLPRPDLIQGTGSESFMHPIADRAELISPFIVMEVLERAHELERRG